MLSSGVWTRYIGKYIKYRPKKESIECIDLKIPAENISEKKELYASKKGILYFILNVYGYMVACITGED